MRGPHGLSCGGVGALGVAVAGGAKGAQPSRGWVLGPLGSVSLQAAHLRKVLRGGCIGVDVRYLSHHRGQERQVSGYILIQSW